MCELLQPQAENFLNQLDYLIVAILDDMKIYMQAISL